MEESSKAPARSLNPNGGGEPKKEEEKPKVVVIMGPTGSGKSRLAIDLATHFPIEIINADSMQVYQGLDVLTNKVPLHEQKGVPHHLLGTGSSNMEFNAKSFRDSAIPIISDILSRNCLPVIVGGTNYYIQALVSSFLFDDSAEDTDEIDSSSLPGNEEINHMPDFQTDSCNYSYDLLKQLDPVAANRIHPNNQRKINLYLSLYARSGVLPSQLYQGKAAEDRNGVELILLDIIAVLYVLMPPCLSWIDMWNTGDDETSDSSDGTPLKLSTRMDDKLLKENIRAILKSSSENPQKILLEEAIDKVKANTRRLVRRQKRRLNQLHKLFGWNINYVDATESISGKLDECWAVQVVGPAVKIIRSFLNEDDRTDSTLDGESKTIMGTVQRDLWTQYTCKACGDRVLRGAHEWEQHKQGRGHRKRISRLRKSQSFSLVEQHEEHLIL
ncbi:PREDICTED: tRNA dimethylallyltransferase 2 isoform X1 [Theobroma cacao]|uniref:tRNA dimethylallyltransferase 2 isoform X1 n=1 Tax=Theobroma cacao TaxID=3641 RepID=A0AB32USJ0_THECC|nr:PREDICTED: tRNA dimethylallyltransferase 2 isoform X1 [Theobroma cacao]